MGVKNLEQEEKDIKESGFPSSLTSFVSHRRGSLCGRVVVIEGRQKERTPVTTHSKATTDCRRNVVCRTLLPNLSQEISNSILVGLYPPSK